MTNSIAARAAVLTAVVAGLALAPPAVAKRPAHMNYHCGTSSTCADLYQFCIKAKGNYEETPFGPAKGRCHFHPENVFKP